MAFSKNVVVEAGSGNYLKLNPGQTKVRIVSDVTKFWKDFDGKKLYLTEEAAKTNPEAKARYAMWTIDRADGACKILECSGAMVRDLQNLADNPEYAFDGAFPYDVIITRVGTTINDTRYTVAPARQNTVLTEKEAQEVAGLENLTQFFRKEAEDASAVSPF
jgi:hypothetical protein